MSYDEDETIKRFAETFGNQAADEVKARLDGAQLKSEKIAEFCSDNFKGMAFKQKQELLVALAMSLVAYGKCIDAPGDIMVQIFLHYLQMAYKDDIKVMAVSERDNQPSQDFGTVFDTGRPRSKREMN